MGFQKFGTSDDQRVEVAQEDKQSSSSMKRIATLKGDDYTEQDRAELQEESSN